VREKNFSTFGAVELYSGRRWGPGVLQFDEFRLGIHAPESAPLSRAARRAAAIGGLAASEGGDGARENLQEACDATWNFRRRRTGKPASGPALFTRDCDGEAWSGRAEFIVPSRGFCVTVESLDDALAWVTIEGQGPKHEAQLCFSTYGIAQTEVDALEQKLSKALPQLLA
jgi:hypothetical protein